MCVWRNCRHSLLCLHAHAYAHVHVIIETILMLKVKERNIVWLGKNLFCVQYRRLEMKSSFERVFACSTCSFPTNKNFYF